MRLAMLFTALLVLAAPAMGQPSETDAIKSQSGVLLGHRDYAALNALAKQYRDSAAKTGNGVSKLSLFYAGFDALPFGDDAEFRAMQWPAIFSIAENWSARAPSPAATIALAKMHVRYAWERLGADGAPTSAGQKDFLAHLTIARKLLTDAKTRASVDPEWAVTMDAVARAERKPLLPVAGTQGSIPLTIAPPPADAQDEQVARGNAQVGARLLFEHGDFEGLNRLAAQLRTSNEKTPAGKEKLNLFYSGIAAYAQMEAPSLQDRPNDARWNKMFARAQTWMNKTPDTAAAIAMARLQIAYAWEWRGNGFARDVKPDHKAHFFAALQTARDVLMAHKKEASIDPEWYVAMIDVLRGSPLPSPDAAAVATEAMARHKYYAPIYNAIAMSAEPKWSGSWNAVEAVARTAVANTRDREGTAYYARVYQNVDCFCDEWGESKMNWTMMKTSFEDIVKRFPVQWNLNRYAYFACRKQDRATAKRVLSRITTTSAMEWDFDPSAYAACKAWVNGEGNPRADAAPL